jgi:hypothetical protein
VTVFVEVPSPFLATNRYGVRWYRGITERSPEAVTVPIPSMDTEDAFVTFHFSFTRSPSRTDVGSDVNCEIVGGARIRGSGGMSPDAVVV